MPHHRHNAMLISARASSEVTDHADPPSLRAAVRAAEPRPHRSRRAQGPTLPREAQIGPRPFYLVDKMKDGPLKQKLSQCTGPFRKTDFSIGHRGAALQFPEHSQGILPGGGADGRRRDRMRRDVYKGPATGVPAFAMRPAHHHQHPVGAGARRQMHACRSSRPIPPPGARRRQNAAPATSRWPNSGRCRPRWTVSIRTPPPPPTTRTARRAGAPTSTANSGTLMTHDESIALIKSLGAKFTPELKAPEVRDAVRRRLHPGEIRLADAARPTRPPAFRRATCSPRVSVLPTSCIG